LLFERHRAAEPELDLARRQFLARLEGVRLPVERERRGFERLWREHVLPLRWHLAGMSGVWLAVLLLNVQPSSVPVAPVAKASLPATPQALIVLRQHRQEILELTESAPAAPMGLPPRRSETLRATAMA